MKKIILYIFLLIYNFYNSQTDTANYIQVRTYLEPVISSDPSARQFHTVQYFDGLGRPKQVVNVKASPSGKDLVTTIPYDGFGRQVDSWLPAPMSSLNGKIQTGVDTSATAFYADTNPFSHKVLESSPLDRIQKQIQVGQDWSANSVTFDYLASKATDKVKKYTFTTSWGIDGATTYTTPTSIIYADNTLYKNSVKDEDGNETIEFKNGRGQTILIRKVLSATENADTYYVYNDYDKLAFVISPLASTKAVLSALDLEDLCYQYRYDGRGRLVEKKLPGKGSEYMVYDQQDRLVLTQDANLRLTTNNFKAKGWLFTKYDKFGRVVYTGFFKNTATRSAMQTALNNMQANAANNELRTGGITFTSQGMPVYYNNEGFPTGAKVLLSVNYYDSYPTRTPYPANNKIQGEPILEDTFPVGVTQSTQSLPTASFVKNIEDDNWTQNYSFYDRKGRAIGGHSINHLGGYTRTESILDFTGVPKKMLTYHKRLNSSTEVKIEETFDYDDQNRLLVHKHQVDLEPEEILTQNTYNDIGQLENKKVGGTMINSPLQSIDYAYNIRGWMTKINDPSNMGTKLFGYKIKYNNVDGLKVPNTDFSNDKVLSKYNGNIAEIDWATANDGILRRYGYVYDDLNRLRAGYYQSSQNPSAKEYFERLLYDSNGNITELKRSSSVIAGNPFATLIDNLTYSSTGNQLQTISDTQQNSDGYPYTAIPKRITYDPNGNMTSMSDKGISAINYNYLNLPTKLDLVESDRSTTVNYTYSADGLKKNKIVSIICPTCRFDSKSTDYLDGFQYENEVLQFVPTVEGYYDFIKNAYIYNYTDHLGNVRLSYYKNSAGVLTIYTESNYYPFGLEHTDYNNLVGNSKYNYKYNGMELQETGMYDYGARMYMPDIGRWGTQDLLTETSRRFSPYTYVNNNPIFFTDPTGMLTDGCPGGKCPEGVTDIKTLPNGQSEVQIQEVVLQGKKKETNSYLLGDCFLCTDKGFAQYHGGQTRSEFNFQRQASLNRGPQPGGGAVMMMGGDLLGLSDVGGILFNNWFENLEPDEQKGALLLGGVALIITHNTKIAGAEAKAIMSTEKGAFSVADWSGYPSSLPKPTGPFKLLEGAEYDAARKAANSANAAMRKANPDAFKGMEIHEIHPVKFGGSPTSPANKIAIPRDFHRQTVTPWWNNNMKSTK